MKLIRDQIKKGEDCGLLINRSGNRKISRNIRREYWCCFRPGNNKIPIKIFEKRKISSNSYFRNFNDSIISSVFFRGERRSDFDLFSDHTI